ncbi:MAG: hypothetical protein NT163_08165 [Chlorobiales bacterium]|nr:hypothetical protein [Chlorobiales bacterium]
MNQLKGLKMKMFVVVLMGLFVYNVSAMAQEPDSKVAEKGLPQISMSMCCDMPGQSEQKGDTSQKEMKMSDGGSMQCMQNSSAPQENVPAGNESSRKK